MAHERHHLFYMKRVEFLELDPAEGNLVGKDPRELTMAELAEMGHERRSPVKAIRAKCLDCSGGSQKEVRLCTALRCAMWPFRMGVNPFYGQPQPSEKAGQSEPLTASAGAAGTKPTNDTP